MTVIQSIEFMVGEIFLILGLSYFFCARTWMAWVERLGHAPWRASLTVGSINLVGGMFILAFHWVWQGVQVIVTVFGLLMAFKGTIHLLFPCWMMWKLKLLETPRTLILLRACGLIIAILAAIVLYDLWQQPGMEDFIERPFLANAAVKG